MADKMELMVVSNVTANFVISRHCLQPGEKVFYDRVIFNMSDVLLLSLIR